MDRFEWDGSVVGRVVAQIGCSASVTDRQKGGMRDQRRRRIGAREACSSLNAFDRVAR
jgi:hypothetical protein